ncbi:hypothetical protein PO909_005760, partial [Leuciscus waleckii]
VFHFHCDFEKDDCLLVKPFLSSPLFHYPISREHPDLSRPSVTVSLCVPEEVVGEEDWWDSWTRLKRSGVVTMPFLSMGLTKGGTDAVIRGPGVNGGGVERDFTDDAPLCSFVSDSPSPHDNWSPEQGVLCSGFRRQRSWAIRYHGTVVKILLGQFSICEVKLCASR